MCMGDVVVGLGGSFASLLVDFSPFTFEVPCTVSSRFFVQALAAWLVSLVW